MMMPMPGTTHPEYRDPDRAACDALAVQYGFPDLAEFYDTIWLINHAYYWNLVMWDDLPNPREMRRKFQSIEKAAQKLRDILTDFSEADFNWLWGPPPRFGDLDLSKHWAVLTHLSEIVERAERVHANFPDGKAGRTHNPAVEIVITNCKIEWEKRTGKPYTFDQHEGRGITEAYEFSEALCRIISPKITPQNVATAMRKEIKG
ncbi:hypothetical protein [Pseudokordiimonas caeni]|uniref:hypothetical protein n=1 Tax=Pseudokordiimonas caeni TaxID=2997908 RepID=UPI0028116954|nr:hypothetical protein [Pseudokordiimonas caeni]